MAQNLTNNLNDIFWGQHSADRPYEELLEEVQTYISDNHAKTISAGDSAELIKSIIRQYLIRQKYSVSGYDTDSLTERLYEDMAGYSFLRKWIYRDGVEEININAYNDIEVILSGGRSMKIPEKFASPTQAIDVMRRMLTSCGMIIDDTMPSVLGHIDKNIRISVDKTPLMDADVGVNASIRIEDGSREFNLVKRDADGNILNSVCHLLTRPTENPELDINQDFLLERVLRKHPNVIGVGEIRAAAECMSVAEASRTGHTCLTTIHSNSGISSYRRMMTLAKRKFQMADDVLMQIMVEAFPVIVYTKQLDDGSRKIMEIVEGEDYTDGKPVYRTLFRYDVLDNGMDENGNVKIIGRHKQCANLSDNLRKRMLENGISAKELAAFTRKEEYDVD